MMKTPSEAIDEFLELDRQVGNRVVEALDAAGYVIVSKAYLDTDLLNSAMVLKAINEAQTQESRQPEG